MKKFTFFVLAIVAMFVAIPVFAQDRNNEDEVVKVEKWKQRAFREGEVIVKFKPQGDVVMRKNAKGQFKTASVSAVDAVFNALGVEEVEQLMPFVGSRKAPRRMRAFNGAEVKDHDLSKLYLIRFNSQVEAPMVNAGDVRDVYQVVEQLQALDEVEFAEPNYLVYTLDVESNDSATYVAEPLYSQQWGPSAIKLPALWNMPKITTKRPVIAIIDTGVDTEHPDLKDNIWVNELEKNGVEGKDDDGNGIVDDIYGYDFVNQTGIMADYNGHGTHCAGIAAAVGNNGIGITGANPDALIMPIAVMQSDGTGDIATIIKGIDYATANGADVLSMSIGGYQYSMAEEQALGKAYASAVLVAAAGNDGYPIEKLLVYPGCLQFVLGVQATTPDGGLAGFSNSDTDPIYTIYSAETDLYNYELRAPGTDIMSTYPQGRYKKLQGTSMATPLAAGAISRLLQCKEYVSWELLFGDLIHTTNGHIDIKAAYDITDADRKPNLRQVTYYLTDTLGDNDGRADAGDTIAIYPVLRNDLGQAENIRMWMEVGYYDATGDFVPDDTTLITFLTDTVDFGRPLSSYAKNRSVNPIRFVVNKKCVDGRHINMCLCAVCDNIAQPMIQYNVVEVENGVEIGGILEDDLTLYPDVHYIVTRELLVPRGVTLTIKPGTIIRFKDQTTMRCEGTLVAKGTPDSMIVFTKADLDYGQLSAGKLYFGPTTNIVEYVKICNLDISNSIEGGTLRHCIIKDVDAYVTTKLEYSVVTNSVLLIGTGSGTNVTKTNIICNQGFFATVYDNLPITKMNSCNSFSNISTYSINKGSIISATYYSGGIYVYKPAEPSYLGSSRDDILHSYIADFNYSGPYTSGNHGLVDLDYVAKEPIRDAHGIVCKVVVNGYDAQDEFEILPPLGVGKHKFEVYFNRAMDTMVTPKVSMGVRLPYTQNAIAEDGSWSADSTIYTAYLTITGKTATDGLNRIYVYGAKDTDHFEIPEEYHRFNVQVAATGSLSTGLMAEAGLGKVKLTWETDEEDFEDLLGYNIYRWTEEDDSTYVYYDETGNYNPHWEYFIRRDTSIINQTLIDSKETEFVDYDVVPGETYYYIIRQMTTSLSSYDLSNPVAATPLTASKGDANGSMTVDVADVVTEVTYLTGGNPQPFIFEAADVNGDGVVNILDVVGTINIILNPSSTGIMSVDNTATYYIENGILYVETTVALGGVQFTFVANRDAEIKPLAALDGFEKVSNWNSETEYMFMAYSMSGKTIPAGRHALLEIGDAELSGIVLSDTQGHNVMPINGTTTNLGVVEQMQLSSPYPNPFREQVVVPYLIGQSGEHAVRMVFTDVAGRTIDVYTTTNDFGSYSYTWTPAEGMLPGVYFVSLYVDNKLMQTSKIVYLQ